MPPNSLRNLKIWLLDHNIPHPLRHVLKEFGIKTETAFHRGWNSLENGALVKAAVKAGFTVILSRDKRFQETAKASLKNYPHLSLVLVLIDQNDGKSYCQDFEAKWKKNLIQPIPGKLVLWP